MLWIILTITFFITTSVACFGCWNLLKKLNEVEENYDATSTWIIHFRKGVIGMSNRLKELDRKGMFKSDDEIGFFFEELKKLQLKLNEYFEYDGK